MSHFMFLEVTSGSLMSLPVLRCLLCVNLHLCKDLGCHIWQLNARVTSSLVTNFFAAFFFNLGGRVPNGPPGCNLFVKLDLTVVAMLLNVCILLMHAFK